MVFRIDAGIGVGIDVAILSATVRGCKLFCVEVGFDVAITGALDFLLRVFSMCGLRQRCTDEEAKEYGGGGGRRRCAAASLLFALTGAGIAAGVATSAVDVRPVTAVQNEEESKNNDGEMVLI